MGARSYTTSEEKSHDSKSHAHLQTVLEILSMKRVVWWSGTLPNTTAIFIPKTDDGKIVLTFSCTFNKCKSPVRPIALCLVNHFPWKPRKSRDGLLPFDVWHENLEITFPRIDGWMVTIPRIVPPYRFGSLSKPDIKYFSSKKLIKSRIIGWPSTPLIQ